MTKSEFKEIAYVEVPIYVSCNKLLVPATFNVPVTLEEAATKPPKRDNVLVATEPLFETVSSVSFDVAA
jgi:hypothetical protein